MIFILDNFDSFTYNISQAIQKLRCQVVVRRAHETSCADIESLRPTHVILSPGPGKPRDHPFIFDVLRQFASRLPVLGVCLGMQAMNEWCGGSIQKDAQPIHGKTSAIFHNGAIPFRDLPSPFVAARYHSLVIDRLADDLEVTAWTVGAIRESPLPMAIRHTTLPLFGVQFHPESYLTEKGENIFRNFLNV